MPEILELGGLDAVIAALRAKGYRVIGPRMADDAIIYDNIHGIADLPAGWGDEQSGGHYRLRPRGDGALFGYSVAAQGWKRFLHPPRERLFAARRTEAGFELAPPPPAEPPLAFVGVRACELAAMAIQAKALDDHRRAFIVAVECSEAGDTCFCESMGTGPEVTAGYDIRLVEQMDPHVFVAHAATKHGADLLAGLTVHTHEERPKAPLVMGRTMDTATAVALNAVPEHSRWDQVAERCLTCGNCTMVCPTCFCTTVEDVTDLTGDHTERWRKWDSCFSIEFSHVHGGALRTSSRARYRQWITHKLSHWYGQFGSSGCVGCGRCITWCPVGIDITAEVDAIGQSQREAANGAG